MPGPLNYTTTVPVERTVAEVHALLAKAGVTAVATAYLDAVPTGVQFVLRRNGFELPYRLPVDVMAMRAHLVAAERDGEFAGSRKKSGTFTSQAHAARVAWRVVKDWLEAQLALIAAGQAEAEQVMLPYLQVDGEVTLYERWRAQRPELSA